MDAWNQTLHRLSAAPIRAAESSVNSLDLCLARRFVNVCLLHDCFSPRRLQRVLVASQLSVPHPCADGLRSAAPSAERAGSRSAEARQQSGSRETQRHRPHTDDGMLVVWLALELEVLLRAFRSLRELRYP